MTKNLEKYASDLLSKNWQRLSEKEKNFLFLSMPTALQAPVIMMSQNRQAEKDRPDAAHD